MGFEIIRSWKTCHESPEMVGKTCGIDRELGEVDLLIHVWGLLWQRFPGKDRMGSTGLRESLYSNWETESRLQSTTVLRKYKAQKFTLVKMLGTQPPNFKIPTKTHLLSARRRF